MVYFIYVYYGRKYGIYANANIPVGPGLLIVHGGNVYLNCKRIGRNFTVYQGVTLGSVHYGERNIPIVKDNVTIYTGAVICGGIVLHNGSTVAANAYVKRDVATNDVVGGLPAKSLAH